MQLVRLFLVGMALLSAAGLSPAQDAAVTNAPPAQLDTLIQHRERWPAQVMLKADTKLVIQLNGRIAGSVLSPAGSIVDVVTIDSTGVKVRVGAATVTVSIDQTDLLARAAVASPLTVATTPAPAAAPAPAPTAPLPSPVSPTPPTPVTPTAPAAPSSAPPLQFDNEIPPQQNFTKAAFRFWSPAYDQPVRGVIVLVPGLSGDGRAMLSDPRWQDLARKYRFALVACFLQGRDYYVAPNGTGDALLQALKDFAGQAARPEIETAPLLLYGESAGGQFNYDFVTWKPDRVLAFIVNKGGYYDSVEPDRRACSDPGLFILGQADTPLRIDAVTRVWSAGREHGALWALTPQPGSGHEFSKTAALARIFFESVLKLRLPASASLSGDTGPVALDETKGWLGDVTSHEIHDASADPEPNHKAAWLPDQDTANAWKAFVSGHP